MESASPPRIILHVDMDAFYASVEQRDRPELRGKAVIVGAAMRRGVVMTASYEARPSGVHSAMPMRRALEKCPHAIVVPPRMDRYREVSEQVMAALGEFSPVVEPLSLDEAFVDMTGCERLFGEPAQMARRVRAAVAARTGLTASVGAAANKFLAKLASDLDKPNGITVVPRGREAEFIAPLPVRRLWGVGPKCAARLEKLGLCTIGDIQRCDLGQLERRIGDGLAAHLFALAHARDERPVEAWRERRSLGSELTLEVDVRGREAVEPLLRRQCERVARGLRESGLAAGGLRVKLRYSRGFRLATRQALLPARADDSRSLWSAARSLLARFDLDAPIRLVGAAAYDLAAAGAGQAALFRGGANKRSQLEHAMDRIVARFGDKVDYGRS